MVKKNSMVKLCASLIVRDEENVIERCLQSFKNGLTAVTVVDTGSVDQTVKIIEGFIKNQNFIGGVRSMPWRGFDSSRNDAIEYSFETIRKTCGLPESGPITRKQYDTYKKTDDDWFLVFIDADDVFYPPELKGKMCEELANSVSVNMAEAIQKEKRVDEYRISSRTGNFGYSFSRVFKLNPSGCKMPMWHYPIHETCYITNHGINITSADLTTIFHYSGRTGSRGLREDKYLSDYTILKRSMDSGRIRPSQHPRIIFYMAQSCHEVQLYDQAIYYYNERTKVPPHNFETYYSYMRQAEDLNYCRSKYNKEIDEERITFERLKLWWKAYQLYPHRREACFELGEYHHKRGEHHIAWSYYMSGLRYDEPQHYDHFVRMDLFGWLYYKNAYISAWYAGDTESFKKYGSLLVGDLGTPEKLRTKVLKELALWSK